MAAGLGCFHHFGGINTCPISPRWIGIPKYLSIMNSHGMCHHLMGKPKNGWKLGGTNRAHQVKKDMLIFKIWIYKSMVSLCLKALNEQQNPSSVFLNSKMEPHSSMFPCHQHFWINSVQFGITWKIFKKQQRWFQTLR